MINKRHYLKKKISYGETFFVPVRARWHESWEDENGDLVPALRDLKSDIGNMLNKAIAAIEDENDSLDGVLKNNIDFNAVKGKTKISDQRWKDLLDHFNQPQFVLINENFEFPDLLGAAYEYLIKYFADSAGKKEASFTPLRRLCAFWYSLPNQPQEMRSTTPRLVPAAFSSRLTSTSRNRARIPMIWPFTVRIPTAPPGQSAT